MSHGAAAIPPAGSRSFTDARGQRWTVVEERTARADWSSAEQDANDSGYPVGWLYFCCGPARKRLRLYPKDWASLADAQLERLAARARPVT